MIINNNKPDRRKPKARTQQQIQLEKLIANKKSRQLDLEKYIEQLKEKHKWRKEKSISKTNNQNERGG